MESITPVGAVVSVQGAVVDVSFDAASLPAINTALIVDWDRPERLLLEVHSHVDIGTIRAVALQATAGLRRGVPVRTTGASVSVPVGEAVLGRLLDVIGTVRDKGPALAPDTPQRGIHNQPPTLEQETSTTAVLETGIKVIDLLAPLALARGDGRYGRLLKTFSRVQLLILDDGGLSVLNPPERRDLLEILDDRHGRASTIVTSQIPVEHWHEIIGDPTLGDAILDRLVHNAHRLQLTGESMRKQNARNQTLDADSNP